MIQSGNRLKRMMNKARVEILVEYEMTWVRAHNQSNNTNNKSEKCISYNTKMIAHTLADSIIDLLDIYYDYKISAFILKLLQS